LKREIDSRDLVCFAKLIDLSFQQYADGVLFNDYFDRFSRKQPSKHPMKNHTKSICFKKFRFLLAEVKA